MTQHITQEQATQIAAQFAEDATYEFNIANAAIQHYLDQHKAELPEPVAWLANYGGNVYTEAQLKQAVRDAQDVNAELVELLEFMWRDVSMNEYAFEKLEAALSKYKGGKA